MCIVYYINYVYINNYKGYKSVLASCSKVKSIKLCNVLNGEVIKSMTKHTRKINNLINNLSSLK